MSTSTLPVAGHVGADSLPWAQWMDKAWVRILRCDEASGTYVMHTRFGAGTELPKHRHFGPVSAWTIKGRWRYYEYDWVATAGDYVFESPGSEHTLFVEEDAEIVFTIEGGLIMTGPNGELWMYEDLASARERYYLALQMQGTEPPIAALGGSAAELPT
jgi:quercetin dioxygenase-like cupin family protein